MDGLKSALLKGQSVAQAGHNKEHRLYGSTSKTRTHGMRSASAGGISLSDYFAKIWGTNKNAYLESKTQAPFPLLIIHLSWKEVLNLL